MSTRLWTKAEVATTGLMAAVVERGNLKLGYQRVVENKGATEVDQFTATELKDHLKHTGRRFGPACWRGSVNSSRCAG